MGRLFSNPKVLTIAIVALAVVLVSIAGGALGASFGLGFLGSPIPHIQVPAERVTTIAGYDLMNTTLMFWLAIIVLLTLGFLATRHMKEVPSRLQSLFEVVVEFFSNTADSVAGGQPKAGRRFLPLVLAIFLGVLLSNWLGILPGVGTVGRIESPEEFVEHHIHEAEDVVHAEHPELSGDALHEAALIHVLEEHGDQGFAVFTGSSGFGTIPLGRGEETKVPLRDIVGYDEGADLESMDIHELEEHIHEGVVREAPADHEELAGQRAGILVPFFRGASTDLNTTLAIAIVAMASVQIWGFRALGVRGYGGKFFPVKAGPIPLAVGVLELFGEFTRIISFTFRLFGNMFAGEILLIAMAFLLPLIGIIPFMGLELFVGVIQAFIFAMLTLVFGVMAVAHHGDEEHHAEEH